MSRRLGLIALERTAVLGFVVGVVAVIGAAAPGTRRPGYRDDGVLIIEFAGITSSGQRAPTGALVLSRYTHRGTAVRTRYGPYSLLRSLEDMLGLNPLAYAKTAPSFAATVLGGEFDKTNHVSGV